MRIVILFVLLQVFFCVTPFLFGAPAKPCPLKFELEVAHTTVYYGDSVYFVVRAVNDGETPIQIPSRINTISQDIRFYSIDIQRSDREMNSHKTVVKTHNAENATTWRPYVMPQVTLKPGEKIEVLFAPIEAISRSVPKSEFHKHYIKTLEVEQITFDFKVSLDFDKIKRYSPRLPKNTDASNRSVSEVEYIPLGNLSEFGYDTSETLELCEKITVRPRNKEEYDLLCGWRDEIPSMKPIGMFGLAFFDRDSPMRIPQEILDDSTLFNSWIGEWMQDNRSAFNSYLGLFSSRTEYIKKRIANSENMANRIVARSKQPNSTISTNMAEFVQLRGFLVDMRYAENENAEKAAFDTLCIWLESANDKELWVKLLSEIGFASISHQEYFPNSKVNRYVKSLQEKFDKTENK